MGCGFESHRAYQPRVGGVSDESDDAVQLGEGLADRLDRPGALGVARVQAVEADDGAPVVGEALEAHPAELIGP
jgi:hypothetical protein